MRSTLTPARASRNGSGVDLKPMTIPNGRTKMVNIHGAGQERRDCISVNLPASPPSSEAPFAALAHAQPEQAPWDLAGLWQLTLTPDPSDPDAPPPFQALLTATADHDWITTETDELVTTQGRWSRSSNDVYNLTGWQFEFVNGRSEE